MTEENKIIPIENIQNHIFTIHGVQVMLDSDLAEMYGVETRILNQAVKRNIDRFPDDFMFQLTAEEWERLKSQIVTSSNNSLRSQFVTIETEQANLKSQSVTSSSHGGKRKLPNVFTEQGVSMLSAVLRSNIAIEVSVNIIRAFVEMRKFIESNANIFNRLSNIEQKQITMDIKQGETDNKINTVLKALEDKSIKPKQGIFYDGQIFDAYKFVADLIRTAKKSIVLIDNYVDDSVLTLFGKNNNKIKYTILTKNISKQLKLDIDKFNQQFSSLEVKQFAKAHDRFLIIDDKELYHFGASLKDLGKKWFAFSKMEIDALDVVNKLNNATIDK